MQLKQSDEENCIGQPTIDKTNITLAAQDDGVVENSNYFIPHCNSTDNFATNTLFEKKTGNKKTTKMKPKPIQNSMKKRYQKHARKRKAKI